MSNPLANRGNELDLTGLDAREVHVLLAELAQIKAALEVQRAQSMQSIQATEQMHVFAMQRLDAYAKHLDNWVKQGGRSKEHQAFVEAEAKWLLDELSKSVRKVITSHDVEVARLAATKAPERPVVKDVTPVAEKSALPEPPAWVQTLLLWLFSLAMTLVIAAGLVYIQVWGSIVGVIAVIGFSALILFFVPIESWERNERKKAIRRTVWLTLFFLSIGWVFF